MKQTLKDKTMEIDNIVSLCGGMPKGEELPQAPTADDISAQILHERTGDSITYIQTDII